MRDERAVGSRQSTDSREPNTADSLSTHDSQLALSGAKGLPTLLRSVARIMRQLAGMPDYRAYLEHLHHCHPGRPPLGEREFFAEYLRARYADGPNRCC